MSDWMGSQVTLGFASVVIGMLAGRVCVWGAGCLPAHLEHQWQREARELLGLESQKPSDLQAARASLREIWTAQISCAALSFMVTLNFGPTMQAFCALLFTWALLALSLIDIEHHLLPDALVMPGLWAGLVTNSFGVFTTLHEALWGCVVGYVSLWSTFHLVHLITGKESLGAGDFKLLALIGAWGGWQTVPYTLATALLLAMPLIARLSLLKDQSVCMPFGPFLSIAGWIALLLIGSQSS